MQWVPPKDVWPLRNSVSTIFDPMEVAPNYNPDACMVVGTLLSSVVVHAGRESVRATPHILPALAMRLSPSISRF